MANGYKTSPKKLQSEREYDRLPPSRGITSTIARESYISGAKCEHELLTRWHDPKEPPEPGRVVLVKRNPSSIIPYDLGHIDNDGNWVDSWCGSPIDDKIIGWRKIHE